MHKCAICFSSNFFSAIKTDLSLTDAHAIYQEYKVCAFHHSFLFFVVLFYVPNGARLSICIVIFCTFLPNW
jgi:hypothetical protein